MKDISHTLYIPIKRQTFYISNIFDHRFLYKSYNDTSELKVKIIELLVINL